MQLTDTEKSQAFAKIIKTKVLAAYAQAIDDLIEGSKFPLEIEPRNCPANVVDAYHFNGQALIDKKVQEIVSVDCEIPFLNSGPDNAKNLVACHEVVRPIEAELK